MKAMFLFVVGLLGDAANHPKVELNGKIGVFSFADIVLAKQSSIHCENGILEWKNVSVAKKSA